MTIWTLRFLAVVYAWSFAKNAELIIRGQASMDRALFHHLGLDGLAIAALLLTMTLDAAAFWSLTFASLGSRYWGLPICYASIGISVLFTSAGFWIARLNPVAAREAYLLSRQSRGLHVNPEALDAILNPSISLGLWAGSLLASLGLAYLVWMSRAHFVLDQNE